MIKEYIQFAIDNGYSGKLELRDYYYDNGCYVEEFNNTLVKVEDGYNTYYSITDIITSKPFIEAVALGKSQALWMLENCLYTRESIIGYITNKQAIAIRGGTLDEFITGLIK